jgi:flagellar motility protein MotE (MotC chaperone)/sporulation protein YlmC with PRC-barrel domain
VTAVTTPRPCGAHDAASTLTPVSASGTRVFVARLAGTSVFDPIGDQVGRVRDVVVLLRPKGAPRAVGLVVEVPGKRRVFVPLTRVTAIDAGQVISTGLVNMRRFEQRPFETLVVGELFDRTVQLADGSGSAAVEDVAIERQRNGDWLVSKVFVRKHRPGRGGLLRRRGEPELLDIDAIAGLARTAADAQDATLLLAQYDELKPADLADVLHDMGATRRLEVASALDDERLADVLEELPEDDQVAILSGLARSRAADVLEAMQPDDAADLLGELPDDQQAELLGLMEPEEARDVRRLLAYEDNTAGGLMTTEPVVLGPETPIAAALAHVRRRELTPALASMVFVVRPPLETPTGRFIGVVHLQRLLREPPHEAIGSLVDTDIDPVPADAPLLAVTRRLATYDLLAIPVVDDERRLLGAVSVDDVLDHLLPEDWRETDEEVQPAPAASTGPRHAGAPAPRGGRRG